MNDFIKLYTIIYLSEKEGTESLSAEDKKHFELILKSIDYDILFVWVK